MISIEDSMMSWVICDALGSIARDTGLDSDVGEAEGASETWNETCTQMDGLRKERHVDRYRVVVSKTESILAERALRLRVLR